MPHSLSPWMPHESFATGLKIDNHQPTSLNQEHNIDVTFATDTAVLLSSRILLSGDHYFQPNITIFQV